MRTALRDKKKIALVLSGGGVKAAAFHIGVCLALQEKGFRFAGGSKDHVQRLYNDKHPLTIRLYVGSSAGAFITSVLSAGYSLKAITSAFSDKLNLMSADHSSEYSLDHLRPLGYADIFSVNGKNLLKSIPLGLLAKSLSSGGGFEKILKERFKLNGLFTTKKIARYLENYALSHNQFNQLGVELYIVATQLNHTRKVLFGNFATSSKTAHTKFVNYASISDAVGASVSLPPVFAPYKITSPDKKDFYYFDGEIRDTLSTHVAVDHGADLVISSYTYQPYHYTKEFGSLHEYGIPAIFNQALYQVIQQKIDRHIHSQQETRNIYTSIDGYMKQHGLPAEHREKILEIIRTKAGYKPNVDYIYIHPRPEDTEMFFADHFSMNPKVLDKILKFGFKSTIQTLRQFDI